MKKIYKGILIFILLMLIFPVPYSYGSPCSKGCSKDPMVGCIQVIVQKINIFPLVVLQAIRDIKECYPATLITAIFYGFLLLLITLIILSIINNWKKIKHKVPKLTLFILPFLGGYLLLLRKGNKISEELLNKGSLVIGILFFVTLVYFLYIFIYGKYIKQK